MVNFFNRRYYPSLSTPNCHNFYGKPCRFTLTVRDGY